MMLQLRFALLAVFAAGLLCACGGGGTTATPVDETTPVTTDDFNLPVPAAVVHGTSAADEHVTGAGFIPGYAGLVAADGNAGVFSPDWPTTATGSGNRDLAWAIYQFGVTGPTGYTGLNLSWANAPERCWLGLADFSADTWEWHECTGSLSLPSSLADYIDVDSLIVAVAVIGETQGRLTTMTLAGNSGGAGLTNLFFLHHSTGSGVVNTGNVRGHVNDYNTANGTSFEFWDHGYNSDGLKDPAGASDGTYGEYTDMTDPPDLHDLWTSDETGWVELRNTILTNHEVISFKSCYPASNIPDNEELEWRKTMYRNMRDFFDTRTDKLFIVMTMPPLNPAATDAGNASRARQFSNWLKSGEYLDGHPNVVCFDLFNVLAQPDDGSADANMLRSDYRNGDDSHPNSTGYIAAGAELAEFFCEAAAAY